MNVDNLVNVKEHLISPSLFFDPEVYRTEQEGIFLHTWLYIGHEQELSNGPGSFLTTYMGEDGVLACRDRDNVIRVYLNSCPHRAMKLCVEERGTLKKIQCPFHAWTFNLNGELIGVPGFDEGYHGELDVKKWGLIEVPKVTNYHGLIFASFNPDIEPFETYLGEAKWYFDMVVNKNGRNTRVLPGKHRWTFNANWKMIADNLAGDNAHVGYAHESVVQTPGNKFDFGGRAPWDESYQARTDKGHGFIIVAGDDDNIVPPELQAFRDRQKAETEATLTPVQTQAISAIRIGTIFPNFSFLDNFGYCVIRVSHPKGPGRTETWSWMLVDTDMPEDALQQARASFLVQMSPSGIIETDDTEMWMRSNETGRGPYRSRFPLNYQMGMGKGRTDPDRPGLIHRPPTEIGSFGFYERWNELMQAQTEAAK